MRARCRARQVGRDLCRALNGSGEERQWPARSFFERELVESILALFYCSHLWVWRRIETVVLLDRTTVRREIALDFELPKWTEKGGFDPDRLFLVPIGVFHRPLGHLRVVDHKGDRITILNHEEDDVLFAHFLWRLLGSDVGLEKCKAAIHDRTIDRLEPTGPEHLAERQMLFEALKRDLSVKRDGSRKRDLGHGYLMVAVLPAAPHCRRMLTVSYEERLDRLRRNRDDHQRSIVAMMTEEETASPSRWVRLAEWISGFRATRIVWPRWSLGDIVSTRIEFDSPRELEVTGASLVAKKLNGDTERLAAQEVGPRAFLIARPSNHDALAAPRRRPYWSRGHLAVFSAAVRAQARSLLVLGALLAFGTAVLFGLGAAFMKRLLMGDSAVAMTTILVVVPGLAAGFLASRSEHAFAAWQLRGIRLRIAAIAAAATVAAASLAFWGEPTVEQHRVTATVQRTVVLLPSYGWLQSVWWAMAGVCILVCVMLASALWVASRAATNEAPAAGGPTLIVTSGEAERDVSARTAEQLAEAACKLFHLPEPPANRDRG